MSRMLEIGFGLILLLLAYLLWILPTVASGTPSVDGRLLVGTLLCGFLGLACVVSWRRPITTRVWLGYFCLVMILLIIDLARADHPDLVTAMLAGLVGLLSGTYALTGYYPESFPMGRVFRPVQQAQSPEIPKPGENG